MKNMEMNKAEIKERLLKAYRHFAWRIMVYLYAHPDILNENNNQEVYDAVREIQIRYHLKHTPKYTREDAVYFVDLMCELEAKKHGSDYYVEQEEMDLRNDDRSNELCICTEHYSDDVQSACWNVLEKFIVLGY